MSQNLRVALWVPQADPGSINNVVTVSGFSTVNKRIPSVFGTPAGGGGGATVDFADNAEMAAGIVANEAVAPATLRTELAREFSIPEARFDIPIAISSSPGAAGANYLVKTDANGVLDATLVILDGGTF